MLSLNVENSKLLHTNPITFSMIYPVQYNTDNLLIPPNTTKVYLKLSCAFAFMLHVLALSQAIIRHVNTKI